MVAMKQMTDRKKEGGREGRRQRGKEEIKEGGREERKKRGKEEGKTSRGK